MPEVQGLQIVPVMASPAMQFLREISKLKASKSAFLTFRNLSWAIESDWKVIEPE